MTIITDYSGANIIVKDIKDHEVLLSPDMRDSNPSWFYWSFGIRGIKGKTIKFLFDDAYVSKFGPAISKDTKYWMHQPDRFDASTLNDNYFTYTFGIDEDVLYFSFAIGYQLKNYEQLISQGKHDYVESIVLTQSNKGRGVPLLLLGKPNAKHKVILSCRHHACESTASHVLDGIIKAAIQYMDQLDAQFIVLPFADLDGVELGDQGKFRLPHDHNRDYTDQPIYNEIKAWKRYIHKTGATIALDLHCPFKWGDRNDHLFLVHKDKINHSDEIFIRNLKEATREDIIQYEEIYDVPIDTDWNLSSTPNATNYYKSIGIEVVYTVEVPYFGSKIPYQVPDFRVLGKRLYAVISKQLQQNR